MPSTKVERYLTVIYEEDYVKFATKVSHFLGDGWTHLNSGCNSIPVVSKRKGTTTTVKTIRVTYWMILTKTERVPI